MSGPAGEVRLSSAIMGHPDRAEHVRALATELAALRPRISYEHTASADHSLLTSAATAWRLVDAGASHQLVVQDDVLARPDLAELLAPIIAEQPDAGIALFCEWGCKTSYAARIAALAGFGGVEACDRYVPTNALVLPAPVALALADRLAEWAGIGPAPDDTIVWELLAERGIRCLLVLPTLVEDRALPSLVGNEVMGTRRSVCQWPDGFFGAHPDGFSGAQPDGEAGAGLSRPSTGPLLGLTCFPFFQWQTGRALLMYRSAGSADWQRRELAPTLAGHGLDDRLTADLTAAALARLDPAGRQLVSGPWLPALTGVVAGLVLCAAALGPLDAAGLRQPLVLATMRTLLPGALRCLAPATVPSASTLTGFTQCLLEDSLALLATGRLSPLACLGAPC